MTPPFTASRIPMTRVRWPAFAAAAVLIGAAGALGACHPAPKANVEAQPRAVRVARVQSLPLASALTVSGLLTPREEAAVTSELGGFRVSKVFVDQGDWVKQGQPLAQLDDTLLRSQIAQQSAVLTQQTLAAERAESQARNVAGLDNQGVLSQEDIDTRRFQAKSARASAVAAQAQLDDLKTRQARLTLRAPVSGRVLARYVRPGDLPAGQTAGQPLFRIARDGLIEIDAEVPEGDLGKLRAGQNAEVTLPDGAKTTGQVRLISPEVDQQSKLGHARILLPVRADLRPGGYAYARLLNVKTIGLVAPDRAVTYDAEGASVFVVDAANRVRRVTVRTGDRAGGFVELMQGPPAGSRVLVTGSSFVLDGDKVAPVENGAS
ncbi:MAG: efflux transporter, family, subunit [Caulobacteraceae bacterium]|nr:efflux transporter, family, subunit [Caulobacteraceae bacterium]